MASARTTSDQASHQRALDLEILNNDFDDPIGIANAFQIILNIANADVGKIIGTE